LLFTPVTIELEYQQAKAGNDQCDIAEAADSGPLFEWLPGTNGNRHDHQCNHLTQLHTQVKDQNFTEQGRIIRQCHFLQACRQTKTVDQAKQEYHQQQIGCIKTEPSAEAVEVLKPLVGHSQRNDSVDQIMVGSNAGEGGKNQCQGMSERKRGDKQQDLTQPGQEKHHTQQEQQMVVSTQHVLGAGPHHIQKTA